MRKREFITLVGGAAAAFPIATRAQQSTRIPTIGFLGSAGPSIWNEWVTAFVQRLNELHWVVGSTVGIEYGWAEGRSDRFAEFAAEFVRLKVDAIVIGGTPAVLAAMQATSAIPIVFVADAMYIVIDGLVVTNRASINTLTLNARLPTMHGNRESVQAGGLLFYGPTFPELWRRSADYIDKILRGTKPADIPVEQPTKFDLVINTKTAKALGLAVPGTVLARADDVIE